MTILPRDAKKHLTTMENRDYSKMFWVTCRSCKHKFGIDPKYVMLYVERIMRERDDNNVTAGLEEALEKTPNKAAEKQTPCPHCS